MESRDRFPPPALTPVAFLERATEVHHDRIAVIDESREMSYGDFANEVKRLAGGLRDLGVAPGDRVSVLAANTIEMLQLHYAVPYAGGVINALNIRLNPDELTYIVDHAGSRLLLVDEAFVEVGKAVVNNSVRGVALMQIGGADGWGHLLDVAPMVCGIDDERALLALNYTSGTTGRSKGVMYAHRGAYLQALAMVAAMALDTSTRYLWTLPMFHCNGWCFPWAVTAVGGAHVMLPRVNPQRVWELVRSAGVTHLCAAPTVLSDLAYGPWAEEGAAPRTIKIATGGAPPTPALLERLEQLNFDVTHLYGLTETYGPAVVCTWNNQWDQLPVEERSRLKARQGIPNVVTNSIRVVDEQGKDVPQDGMSMGEVLIRGNNVMVGYYRDPESTRTAMFEDAWFRTGDLGVLHSDGYLELRDRTKDIIISGGENIASVEVEAALASHPAVHECAVVAGPDERLGEVPVAFVRRRSGADAQEDELIAHVRQKLARFKAPRRVIFADLPKTATGKIQKFRLRQLCEAE